MKSKRYGPVCNIVDFEVGLHSAIQCLLVAHNSTKFQVICNFMCDFDFIDVDIASLSHIFMNSLLNPIFFSYLFSP